MPTQLFIDDRKDDWQLAKKSVEAEQKRANYMSAHQNFALCSIRVVNGMDRIWKIIMLNKT